jgi:prepilin-type N-terminal cleavage/methylation domain-containing protein
MKGFSLIETIVALGIFAIVVSSTIELFLVSQETRVFGENKIQASFLINEYLESLKNIKRANWEALVNGRYIINSTSGALSLESTAGDETIGDYHRYLTIEGTLRDSLGKLVETGGTNDPSTKKVTVFISWEGLHPGNLSQTIYLTRYLDNLAWTQTSEAEFKAGTNDKTTVINNEGGEVVLGAGGQAQWCAPVLSAAELDLPKQGVANAISAVEGHVSVGTGENSSGVSYAHVTVTDTHPPVPTIAGTFNGYKTNDIWGDNHYAYLATNNNQKEVVILDISQAPYSEIGYFNIPGSNNASSVFVSGNKGYVTAGWWLYVFDLTSKSGSRPQLGTRFFMLGSGTSIVVKGNYAYVSLAGSLIEMQIIDITNPNYIFSLGWADVNGRDGKRVFINDTSTRAYLATNSDPSLREFFIIDISSKSGSRPTISSYEADGMDPTSLAVVPGNKAIIVGKGGEEYQVIDITTEANPTRCGGINIDSGINGITAVLEADGDAYSYIITGDASSELKIIEGGPGGQYASAGVFESQTLNVNHLSAFNRFFANFNLPSQTTIKFQVAVKDPTSGSCSGVTFASLDFVGPDGTSLTYFTSEAAIPLNDDGAGFENPGQCFRFRAYLETADSSQTPTLYDFTVNYSP